MRSPLLQVSLRSDSEDFWRTMSVASMPCRYYESGSRHLKTFKFTGTQIWPPKKKTCEPTGKHTIFIVLAVDSSCTSKWLVTWGISVPAFQSAHPQTLRPKTWRAGQGILWVARGWRGHVFLPMIWDVDAGVFQSEMTPLAVEIWQNLLSLILPSGDLT